MKKIRYSPADFKNLKIGLIIFCLVLTFAALSAEADLEIEIIQQTNHSVRVGDRVNFQIKITNNGPDYSGDHPTFGRPITIASQVFLATDSFLAYIEKNDNQIDNCGYVVGILDPIPGNPPGIAFTFTAPALQSGESVICYATAEIFRQPTSGSISWDVYNSGFGVNDNNTTNNRFTNYFFRPVVQVPVNSVYFKVILSILILTLGYTFLWNNSIYRRS